MGLIISAKYKDAGCVCLRKLNCPVWHSQPTGPCFSSFLVKTLATFTITNTQIARWYYLYISIFSGPFQDVLITCICTFHNRATSSTPILAIWLKYSTLLQQITSCFNVWESDMWPITCVILLLLLLGHRSITITCIASQLLIYYYSAIYTITFNKTLIEKSLDCEFGWLPRIRIIANLGKKGLGTKCVFKHQDLQMVGPNLTNVSNFHPLEVVDRGSETQL